MHTLKSDERGLSETVGALLLVLIVVTASASFAVFVQARQEEVQQRELVAAERASESIAVLGVVPELDSVSGTDWSSFNFTLANLHVDAPQVVSAEVNGRAVKQYTAWRWNSTSVQYESEVIQAGDVLRLAARERFYLNVTIATDLYDPTAIAITDFVRLALFSGRLNTFERTFIPPTAVGLVDITERWDSTAAAYVPVVLLDGRQSDHPDPAARIIAWEWLINKTGPDTRTWAGRYVKSDFVSGVTYAIRLTVTDSNGMIAEDEFTFTP